MGKNGLNIMSETNPYDAAFASAGSNGHHTYGLTKREHFAAMLMQNTVGEVGSDQNDVEYAVFCATGRAKAAVIMADALIAELNKETKDE